MFLLLEMQKLTISLMLFLLKVIYLYIVLDLKVIKTEKSTVGQYAPITLSFVPGMAYPDRFLIYIQSITTEYFDNCINDVSITIFDKNEMSEINAAISHCFQSGNSITMSVASSMKNGKDYIVSIEIEQVLYGLSLAPNPIEIKVTYRDATAVCYALKEIDLETFTNTKDFKADYPANFAKALILTPQQVEVCQTYNFIWKLTPALLVARGSLIAIEFNESISINNNSKANFTADLKCDGGRCTGELSIMLVLANDYYLMIEGIKMPNTKSHLYSTITTYAGVNDNEEAMVHKTSTDVISFVTRIVERQKTVTAKEPNLLTIGDLNTYEISVKGLCGVLENVNVIIKPPDIFNTDSIVKKVDSLTEGEAITLSLKLINPNSKRTEEELESEYFNIKVIKDNTELYIIKDTLAAGIAFSPGYFEEFSLTGPTGKAGDTCNYVFSIKIGHTIPGNGKLKLILDPAVNVGDESEISINFKDSSESLGIATYESNLVLITFYTTIKKQSNLIITLKHIKNPYIVKDYTDFDITSMDSENREINLKHPEQIIKLSITQPGDAIVNCTIDNENKKINLANDKYICTFKSYAIPIPYPNNTAINMLKLEIPKDVSNCIPKDDNYASIEENSFIFNIIPNILEQTVEMTCDNPPTTKPTEDFILTLLDNEKREIIRGKAKVATNTGTKISSTSCQFECEGLWPRTATSCTFSFERTNTHSINRIEITSKAFTENSLCIISDGKCKVESGLLTITYTNNVVTTKFEITKMEVTNPDASRAKEEENKFYIKTYSEDGYIVDESYEILNNAYTTCVLPIECDYPCKECQEIRICTTCTDYSDHNGKYYWYEGLNICEQLKDDEDCKYINYYKKGNTCLKCSDECKTCSIRADNCTSCENKYFHGNKCVDECKGNTYHVDTPIKKCELCKENCSKCNNKEECTECIDRYSLDDFSCVENCPEGKYEEDKKCLKCKTECKTCINGSTCKSCNDGGYLFGDQCISASKCTEDKTSIADSQTNICSPCSSSCLTCQDTIDTCTSCSAPSVLYYGSCEDRCPNTYYALNFECKKCVEPCANCNTVEECTSCIEGKFFMPEVFRCRDRCPDHYYDIRNVCHKCADTCLTCERQSFHCTSCEGILNLHNNRCIENCMPGTFAESNECKQCSDSCLTCKMTSTHCITCRPDKPYLYRNTCVEECLRGTTSVSGVCETCDRGCVTCSGSVSYCTTCHGTDLSYGGKCYTQCPLNTTQSLSERTCVLCEAGCEECSWGKDSKNHPDICIKCIKGYKYLNYRCYSVCPSNYILSTDELTCIPSNDSSASSNIEYLPFPHLIAVGMVAIIIIAGQAREGRALIDSNLIIILNYSAISTYIFQGIWSYAEEYIIMALIILITILLQLIINVIFLISYKRLIARDEGFKEWASRHRCAKRVILGLSTVFTIQTYRLLYSRFMGFGLFFAKFDNFDNILKPLNCFSWVQILLVQGVIAGLDVVQLIRLSWGNNLYIFVIESLVLSLILLILIIYSMGTKDLKEEQYTKINSSIADGRFVDEEKVKKEIYNLILKQLKLPNLAGEFNAKKKLKRRCSLSPKSSNREEDPKKTGSYPCSPRSVKKGMSWEKEVIDLPPEKLPDNVYSEAITFNKTAAKPLMDYGIQTPPFQKLEEFKKHLQKSKRKPKRMFENTVPLEMIPETPYDNEDNTHEKKEKDLQKTSSIDTSTLERKNCFNYLRFEETNKGK